MNPSHAYVSLYHIRLSIGKIYFRKFIVIGVKIAVIADPHFISPDEPLQETVKKRFFYGKS
jgi:hypothetical protein